MISLLRGEVASIGLDHVVVVAGGFGMKVLATPATLASLRHDGPAQLHTSLVVREDSLTLFGFAEADERDVFETVQTVSGVGPRLALAMLAVHNPDSLRHAVEGEDLKSLERVPGIGRKGASRIVLELKGKLGASSGSPIVVTQTPQEQQNDVVEALVGLGWNAKVATDTVTRVLDDPEITAKDSASVLRAALRLLAGDPRG